MGSVGPYCVHQSGYVPYQANGTTCFFVVPDRYAVVKYFSRFLKDYPMALTTQFVEIEPARAEIDALRGPVVVEFGAPWCTHCQAAQPLVAEAFASYQQVRHVKVEDGPGRPLGRSFRVKLWPTLVFLRDGQEVARLVRPEHASLIATALKQIASAL
jgi:thioredoxin 1